MQFDSNRAWQDAMHSVSANKDVLWALAGVFYVLPSLAFSLAYPQPDPAPGVEPEQLLAQLSQYYVSAAPLFVVVALVQLLGTLTILTLFTDSRRPTVGEAIRLGAAGIVPVILAQLLIGLGVGLAGVAVITLGAVIGSPAAVTLLLFLLAFGLLYVSLRFLLVSPVVVVDGLRNPVAALRRSWDLTRGNVGRLALFLILLGIAVAVLFAILMLVVGGLLAVLVGPETARFVAALVSSLLTGAATVIFVSVTAATHRQLSGPSAAEAAAPFE